MSEQDVAPAQNYHNGRAKPPPPPPLRLPGSNFSTRSDGSVTSPPGANILPNHHNPHQSPSKLLYELPPSSSIRSPPPRSSFRSQSPPQSKGTAGGLRRTSFGASAALQTRPSNSRRDGPESPGSPPPRSRSSTPLLPKQEDLDIFAGHCHAWYYDQTPLSGRLMSQTLTNIAPAHRATYTRLQASIRSAFHTDQSIRKISEFRALLSSTQPGNSLTPSSRVNPSSPHAQKERFEKFGHFVQAQCLASSPGTHPFFEGLYGVIRLQTLPENLGGAGSRRIEWEIDDAVFMESAGKDFMLEAVDVLKGVLGFEEALEELGGLIGASESTSALSEDVSDDGPSGLDSLPAPTRMRRMSPPGAGTPPHSHPSLSAQVSAARSRASSDPFLDPGRSLPSGLSTPSIDDQITMDPEPGPLIHGVEQPRGQPSLLPPSASSRSVTMGGDITPQTLSEPQLRTWVFPASLTNPELHKLLAMFPPFITQRNIARFSSASSSGGVSPKILEEGLAIKTDIRIGTGRMRLGLNARNNGWNGGFWARLKQWFRNLFG